MNLENGIYLTRAITKRVVVCTHNKVKLVGCMHVFDVNHFFSANVLLERMRSIELHRTYTFTEVSKGDVLLNTYLELASATGLTVTCNVMSHTSTGLEVIVTIEDLHASTALKRYKNIQVTDVNNALSINELTLLE